jgi:formiminotetrahydrofolate cyclodeaminase
LHLLLVLVEKGNLNAISDAGSGGALAMAAMSGSGANVRINLHSYKSDSIAIKMIADLDRIEQEARNLIDKIKAELLKRAEINLL